MTDPKDSLESPCPAPPGQAPEFLTETRFEELNLPEVLLRGLSDSGFDRCSPIQAQVLPVSLTGKDVAGQAKTGTGKTAAFLVTIFARLLSLPPEDRRLPSSLIVAPTRELALQIYEEALKIGRHMDFRFALVVGGIDYQKQASLLKEGVDIVVCTPGRIIDYYKQKIFQTQGIRIVVIDEADRLLDLGFAKDMRYILKNLPPYDKRQSMLFSATLSYSVMELTYEYMNLPEFIAVAAEDVTVEGVRQELFHVENESKLRLLLGLLNREEWTRALIFVNTKSGVEWLTRKLKGNGFPAEGITGDLTQKKRFQLMERFKKAAIKILVATDVASRGIHVEDISHVFNFDLPQDPEDYIHRIGRTARAGKTGTAISLACEKYVYHLEAIEAKLGVKIPVIWFDEGWLSPDQCGPVSVPPRERSKPSRDRKGKTPQRREGPKPHGAPAPPPLPKRDPNYFPGTFFGFGPPRPPEASGTTPDQAPPEVKESGPSVPAETAGPPEEKVEEKSETAQKSVKKRRRRRKPKRAAEDAPEKTDGGPDSLTGAPNPEDTGQDPAPGPEESVSG